MRLRPSSRSMDESPRANLCRPSQEKLHNIHGRTHLTRQTAMTEAGVEEVDDDGVWLWVLGADLTTGEDLQQLAHVIAVVHARRRFFGRVQCFEDGGGVALGEGGEEVDFRGHDDEVGLNVVLLGIALEDRQEEECKQEGRYYVGGDGRLVLLKLGELAGCDACTACVSLAQATVYMCTITHQHSRLRRRSS